MLPVITRWSRVTTAEECPLAFAIRQIHFQSLVHQVETPLR
jgi:hypothetical protein